MIAPFLLSISFLLRLYNSIESKNKEINELKDIINKNPETLHRNVDYGDFSAYGVRILVADYCRDVQLGLCGWGVDFKTWLEFRGLRHEGMFKIRKTADYEE